MQKRTPTEWLAWDGQDLAGLPLDGGALVWSYAHGPLGRLWSVTSPDGCGR